jgi:hypothetical protein
LFLQGCDEILDGAWNSVQEDFHYSYPLKAGGRLEVENQNGPIDISGWDQNTVDISGTKYASSQERLKELRVEVSPSSNAVTIRTIRADSHWGSGGVRYTIRVPRRTELSRIVSSNGPIHVESIDGAALLRTSNGPVRGVGVTGSLEVEHPTAASTRISTSPRTASSPSTASMAHSVPADQCWISARRMAGSES